MSCEIHNVNKDDTPSPGLLSLKKHGKGWVVETGQENKVNEVADVLINLRR